MSEPEEVGAQASASPAEPSTETQDRHQDGGPQQFAFRRAPRYGAFILTGAVLGVLVAAVLSVAFPNNGDFSARALFGYLAVILALILGLVGALVAIFVERPRR